MQLKALQQSFLEAIYENKHDIAEDIKENGITPELRLNVYQNNVFGAITNALRETYEAVYLLVGKEFFGYMVRRYVEEYQPVSGDLGEYGGYFPEFLSKLPECAALPYLADVAKLEWLRHLSYSAEDHKPASLSILSGITPERLEMLTFQFSPSLFLLRSEYPVNEIWEFCFKQADTDISDPIQLEGKKVNSMIYRDGYHVTQAVLDQTSYQLLEKLQQGESIGQAIDMVSDNKSTDFDLAGFLEVLFSRKIIMNVFDKK